MKGTMKQQILETLTNSNLERPSATAIARHICAAPPTVASVAKKMVDQGILTREHDGKAWIYSIKGSPQ